MPLFNYGLTYASETRYTELRKSTPQGWLLDAVEFTFPEIVSRRKDEFFRLRLEKVSGLNQTCMQLWKTAPMIYLFILHRPHQGPGNN